MAAVAPSTSSSLDIEFPTGEKYLSAYHGFIGPVNWVALRDMRSWKYDGPPIVDQQGREIKISGQRSIDLDWVKTLANGMKKNYLPTVYPMIGVADCEDDKIQPNEVGKDLPALAKNIGVQLISGQHRKAAAEKRIKDHFSQYKNMPNVSSETIWNHEDSRWPVILLKKGTFINYLAGPF